MFVGLIAIDWGTTGFRAWLVNGDGEVQDQRSATLGLLQVPNGDFAGALNSQVGDWMAAHPERPVLMSGMIGSRQGWVEAPYIACPANLASLAGGLVPVPVEGGHPAFIVPGVSYKSPGGVPDVMRGEETQILGAIEETGITDGLICMPGTHSKWVTLENGTVASFQTHMTGEMFETIRGHTILSAMMDGVDRDETTFLRGVDRSGEAGGLLNHLFGIRALGLFDELEDRAAASYLSGLLIGHEIRAARAVTPVDTVHLIGSETLTAAYTPALAHLGVEAVCLPDDLAARGLVRLARVLALQQP